MAAAVVAVAPQVRHVAYQAVSSLATHPMSTLEGAHPRARFHLHTGYREGQGGLVYPSIGSIAAKEIGNPSFPLPNGGTQSMTPSWGGSTFRTSISEICTDLVSISAPTRRGFETIRSSRRRFRRANFG